MSSGQRAWTLTYSTYRLNLYSIDSAMYPLGIHNQKEFKLQSVLAVFQEYCNIITGYCL